MWQASFCSEKWHAKLKGEKRVFGGSRASAFDSCAALPATHISHTFYAFPQNLGRNGWVELEQWREVGGHFSKGDCKGID